MSGVVIYAKNARGEMVPPFFLSDTGGLTPIDVMIERLVAAGAAVVSWLVVL